VLIQLFRLWYRVSLPLNCLFLLSGAAQAMSAVKRITLLLQRDTRARPSDENKDLLPSERLNSKNASEVPMKISHASFRVGTEASSFTVVFGDFSVRRGEVVAVCGPVGSGKSSLVNGIIDEIPKASTDTEILLRGKIALVPQTPFVLNATLRDNILFGLPYDQELYNRVIEACCLQQDIIQLGQSGDLTEIGERGITLSGGTYH
jgi:ATP-binding cassette subfamily C (CFTR/MRP) protein 1